MTSGPLNGKTEPVKLEQLQKASKSDEHALIERLEFYVLENSKLRDRIKELEDENELLKKGNSSQKE